MRRLSLLCFALILASCTPSGGNTPQTGTSAILPSVSMTIDSPSIQQNENIPSVYTCDSRNISPPLRIGGVPAEAKSLALIMDDPDAPNGTFTHWIMWNINPTNTDIKENAPPADAVQGINGAKKLGYTGPCPPSGSHRYYFRVYALNNMLNLP